MTSLYIACAEALTAVALAVALIVLWRCAKDLRWLFIAMDSAYQRSLHQTVKPAAKKRRSKAGDHVQ
jgi:hypothetical protein